MNALRFAALAVLVSAAAVTGQVARRDLDGKGQAAPTQEERIQSAITSMRARAVFPEQGEIGETGEWIAPPTESVTYAGSGVDFGASLDVALLYADSLANATAVQNVLLPDPRINSITGINTVSVTPTAAELSAFDVVMVWTNSTPLNNVVLGDNIANYVDGGGGCVLTMFALRASVATRTLGGRFLADNYYCISQSIGASTTGAATLGTQLQPGSEMLDGVVTFVGGTSGFRTPAPPVTNAVVVANWSTGQTLIAHRDDLAGGRVDLNFFCFPGSGWDATSDGRMVMVNALAMASKQNLWHPAFSQAPFSTTGPVRNSNLPGVTTSQQQWADDFTIAGGGVITDLKLWAVYTSLAVPPPPVQEMTVRFFADNAGLPGAELSSSVGLVTTFRDTGIDNTNVPGTPLRVYEFRVSLLAAFVAEPGVKYWVSPLGNTAGVTWAWAPATGVGTSAFRTGDAGAWLTTANPGTMAMILGSDEFRFGGEVTAFNFTSAVRGNLISVQGPQVLDRIIMKLSVPVGGATLYSYVMEANTTAGPFTPIFTRSGAFAGGLGTSWYSSGRLNVILNPGKIYFVGFGWNAESVEFYRDDGMPSTWPLGARHASGGLNSAVNPVVGPAALLLNPSGLEYDMRLNFSVAETCYPNCDGSTGVPALTPNDFQCFLDKFAANDPYANCDGSTIIPILTANDFQCFLNAFAAGCP